jgi:hypothetical protein
VAAELHIPKAVHGPPMPAGSYFFGDAAWHPAGSGLVAYVAEVGRRGAPVPVGVAVPVLAMDCAVFMGCEALGGAASLARAMAHCLLQIYAPASCPSATHSDAML